jgi:uncharacterized damage-inducible protein DinB
MIDLVRYNDWANERLAAAVRGVPAEAQSASVVSSFGSLRETVAHIVSAEWIWLCRWLGESPAAAPSWATESMDQLLARLDAVRADRASFLAGLAEADFERRVDYRNLAGASYRNTLADLIRHVVNHSTYHRGQAATQLRQLGYVPPATDFIMYRRDASAG